MTNIKILIVDDHKILRDTIELGFKQVRGMKVVGVANDAKEALKLLTTTQPDIVLLDLNLPDMSGLEVTKRIIKNYPDVKVIIMTQETGEQKTRYLLRAGARGYIVKEEGLDRFIHAVKMVHHGQHYITPKLAEKLVFTDLGKDEQTLFDSLSERELEVLLMVLKGMKNQDIAAHLNLSPKTVNTHRCNIYKKVKVENSIELMIKAIKSGIIEV